MEVFDVRFPLDSRLFGLKEVYSRSNLHAMFVDEMICRRRERAVATYPWFGHDAACAVLLEPWGRRVRGPGRSLFLPLERLNLISCLKLDRCGGTGTGTPPSGCVCGACRAGGTLLRGGGYCCA